MNNISLFYCTGNIMQEDGVIPCPICRKKTTIPDANVASLPLHKKTSTASKMVDSLRKELDKAHIEIENLKVTKVNLKGAFLNTVFVISLLHKFQYLLRVE